MQTHDSDPPKPTPQPLSAGQLADRMGLTTRQLQDLRLRGIGPQIVQRGLSIHYELADVREIERHEAMAIIDQVLASDRPLALLRALVDLAGFKASPILQQVSPSTTTITVPATKAPATPPDTKQPTTTPPEAAAPAAAAVTSIQPSQATPPNLTVIPADTTAWHLVYTKAQQGDIALLNLERQGYTCYLPKLRIEKIRRRKAEVVIEPMFPRYLFVRLDLSGTFMAAQEILAERSKKLTDAELLDHLKALYAECGRLSGFIIDQAPALPNAATYIQRFGSLTRAYELVGYHCPRSTEFLEINRRLRQLHPEIVSRTEHTIAELGGHITRDPKTDLLTLNDELVISLVLARCQTAANGHQRWRIRFDSARFDPDITVAIRLDAANTQELDYYLLPRLDLPDQEIRVSNKNSADFECFRFDDLNFFYGMSERERLQRRV